MESLLASSQRDGTVLSIDIPDLSGGPATLYVLNGGARPPMPVVGDFAYDLRHLSFKVYHRSGWENTTRDDIQSRAWHPNGNHSIVTLTAGGLPYWMPANKNEDKGIHGCKFDTVEDLLDHFRTTVDVKRIKVSASAATRSKSKDHSVLHLSW